MFGYYQTMVDYYDAGRGVNDEVDGIEVIHATTIQTYYTEVPVPIIKLVPGEEGG
jgi:hypothetical protein